MDMFYQIVFNEKAFKKCIESIIDAYYPEEEFGEELKYWRPSSHDPEELQDSIDNKLDAVIENIVEKKFYKYESGQRVKKFHLPFLRGYYELFLERKWPIIKREQGVYDNLHVLHRKVKANPEELKNYSKYSGTFYHFVNVDMALARLINYFSSTDEKSKPKNIKKEVLKKFKLDKYNDSISYTNGDDSADEDQKIRIVMLMLSAFYHDIGKSITNARHGMEGAIIFSESTGKSWADFKDILKNYKEDYEFTQEDLLYLADLVLYHDLFGTLSTGESGYLRLIEVVDRIKKYSIKKEDEAELWGQRFLFDLWLLNTADILVSIKDKYKNQKEIWEDKEKAYAKIDEFFKSKQAKTLLFDLEIALRLLDIYNDEENLYNLPELRKKALFYSKEYAIERIRRLIYINLDKTINPESDEEKVLKVEDLEEPLKNYIEDDYRLFSTINNSIGSVGNLNEFSDRFSYIAFMDYSLGFFQKITEYILKQISDEIIYQQKITKWISTESESEWRNITRKDKEDYWKIQARYFVDNYTAIVIHIISLLIFKDEKLAKIRNLEFKDAADRLKEKKIEAILALNGPYKERYTTNLILQTIFYW